MFVFCKVLFRPNVPIAGAFGEVRLGLFGNSADRERANEIASLKADLAAVSEQYVQERSALKLLKGAANAAARKWEYLTVDDPEDDRLEDLGRDGWEMVGLASYTVGWGVAGNSSMKVHVRHVFKRPIVDVDTAEMSQIRDAIAQLVHQYDAIKAHVDERDSH